MARICTSLVKRNHAYTGEDIPWDMDDSSMSPFLRYLRGGGIRAFGNPASVSVRIRRQNRFLCAMALLAVLWLVFFFV